MKKYFYVLGVSALALNVSGLPAVPEVPGVSGISEVSVPPVPGVSRISVPGIEEQDFGNIQVGDVQISSDRQSGANVRVGDVQVNTSSQGANVRVGNMRVESGENGRANVQVGDIEVRAGEEDNSITVGDFKFGLERNAVPVFSFERLKQSIEQRRQELDEELASTTPQVQDILENVNQVRLAVHTLLASENLLGGIGQQVSQIARQMNDSVATTTSAETKIHSRGFFSQLLFGGDSAAADTISEEVAKNQEQVQKLAGLLSESIIPAEVKTTLTTQITALQAEQARLQDLAKKEKSRWGIFSWRFF